MHVCRGSDGRAAEFSSLLCSLVTLGPAERVPQLIKPVMEGLGHTRMAWALEVCPHPPFTSSLPCTLYWSLTSERGHQNKWQGNGSASILGEPRVKAVHTRVLSCVISFPLHLLPASTADREDRNL